MIFYVENPYGFGRYNVIGDNARAAAKELERLFVEVDEILTKNNEFCMEGNLSHRMNGAIQTVIDKYNVEVKLTN